MSGVNKKSLYTAFFRINGNDSSITSLKNKLKKSFSLADNLSVSDF